MFPKMRRIVTGHNEKGRSVVMIDGPPPHSVGREEGGLFEIWNTDGNPVDSTDPTDRVEPKVKLSPPTGGTKFRYNWKQAWQRPLNKSMQPTNGLTQHATPACTKPKPSTILFSCLAVSPCFLMMMKCSYNRLMWWFNVAPIMLGWWKVQNRLYLLPF